MRNYFRYFFGNPRRFLCTLSFLLIVACIIHPPIPNLVLDKLVIGFQPVVQRIFSGFMPIFQNILVLLVILFGIKAMFRGLRKGR